MPDDLETRVKALKVATTFEYVVMVVFLSIILFSSIAILTTRISALIEPLKAVF